MPQQRLFGKAMKILHADRLARLSQKTLDREAILRRLAVDKSTKRFRQLLAGVAWDVKITHWLHNTLCDSLPVEYLGAYLDVMQTMRKKIPQLVDKMVGGRMCDERLAPTSKEAVRMLLKRKWDPTPSVLIQPNKIVRYQFPP